LPTRRLLSYLTSGAKAVIKTDVNQTYQQWYFDYWAKCIKTKVNNYCINQVSADGNGRGAINVAGSNTKPNQMFRYSAPYLVNALRGAVLDVSGGKDTEA